MHLYLRVCPYNVRIFGENHLAKGGSGGGERQTGIDSGYLLQAEKTLAEERVS